MNKNSRRTQNIFAWDNGVGSTSEAFEKHEGIYGNAQWPKPAENDDGGSIYPYAWATTI